MTAMTDAAPAAANTRGPMIGLLRGLLLIQAAAGLGLAVFLSLVADAVAARSGIADETAVRFAASGAFLFALFAAIASQGARRRRGWAWTMAAILQVLLAIGTGVAVLVADWHPAYLAGFALASAVMLVLSVASVRRALGQA